MRTKEVFENSLRVNPICSQHFAHIAKRLLSNGTFNTSTLRGESICRWPELDSNVVSGIEEIGPISGPSFFTLGPTVFM